MLRSMPFLKLRARKKKTGPASWKNRKKGRFGEEAALVIKAGRAGGIGSSLSEPDIATLAVSGPTALWT